MYFCCKKNRYWFKEESQWLHNASQGQALGDRDDATMYLQYERFWILLSSFPCRRLSWHHKTFLVRGLQYTVKAHPLQSMVRSRISHTLWIHWPTPTYMWAHVTPLKNVREDKALIISRRYLVCENTTFIKATTVTLGISCGFFPNCCIPLRYQSICSDENAKHRKMKKKGHTLFV